MVYYCQSVCLSTHCIITEEHFLGLCSFQLIRRNSIWYTGNLYNQIFDAFESNYIFIIITVLKKKIEAVEKQIDTEQKNVTYWKDYKEKGQYEHKKEIQVLSKEMEDMANSFNEMIGIYS